MTLGHARVIKASVALANGDAPTRELPALARRIPRATMDAHDEAAQIVARAREEATQIRAAAVREAASVASAAASEARGEELARIAAELLVERARDGERDARDLDRAVQLAVVLAERLVGEALVLDPARILALANEALREARGARRVTLDACEADVPALEAALAALGPEAVAVRIDPALARGSLVVHTDIGAVDARLAPQLTRLAAALREAIASSPATPPTRAPAPPDPEVP